MQQLETLKHGSNADVQAYTNRFLQLDLMIVGQQNELSRVFAYEQGLPESYRVKSAEKQHTTLAATIASSLALWNAKSVARTQSHGGPRHGRRCEDKQHADRRLGRRNGIVEGTDSCQRGGGRHSSIVGECRREA